MNSSTILAAKRPVELPSTNTGATGASNVPGRRDPDVGVLATRPAR